MQSSCGCTSPVVYSVDQPCQDPLYTVPEFTSSKPGGYACGAWVTYQGGWYISLVGRNTRSPHDRTVWDGPFTLLDLLSLLGNKLLPDPTPCERAELI